jgi:hypothetical protein
VTAPTRRAILAAPLLLAVPALAAGTDGYAALLAEEHAAIHLYGVLGPRLPASLRDTALAAYDDHRAHRDALIAAIRAAGGTPAPAQATYALPGSVATAALARGLAVRIEDSLALRWHAAVRAVPAAERARAATAFADESAHLARYRYSERRALTDAAPPFPGR